MQNFPSLKVITFTLVGIVLYLSIDFYVKGEKTFFQLKYNWDKKEVIDSYKVITIDTISYNYLSVTINGNPGSDLNINNTCSLDDTHYFRYSSISKSDNRLIFRGVYWINSTPESDEEINTIKTLELPIIQKGDHTVCMIGDSQLTWQYGRYTRKDISNKVNDVKFIGENVDVIGYPYQATLLNNSRKLVNQLGAIPDAETYVLFIGAHEIGVNNTRANLKEVITSLLEKNSSLILIIPPIDNDTDQFIHQKIVKDTYLDYLNHPDVAVIDLNKRMQNSQNYFLPDGNHLNPLGHNVLTKSIIEILKDLK